MPAASTKQKKKSSPSKTKLPPYLIIPLVIAFVCLIGSVLFYFSTTLGKSSAEILTTSSLMKVLDVAELSTSEFAYNGIAEYYEKPTDTAPKCRIRYHATVKAGINLDEIKLEADDDEKVIIIHLPDITITSNTVDEDGLSFIPSNQRLSLADALRTCEEDAKNEAMQSGALINTAEDNLHSSIEALLMPFLRQQGYKLKFD